MAAVVDVETTGLDPDRDEVLELAITLFRYDRVNGQVVEIVSEYSGLREPSCRIPREASKMHGITRRMVRGLALDYHKIRAMLRQAEFVVAHNADFDRSFVGGLIPFSRKRIWLCSLYDIDWQTKGFESGSIESLAAAHAIKTPKAHRAGADVATLLALLSHKPRRRPYLHELLRNTGML